MAGSRTQARQGRGQDAPAQSWSLPADVLRYLELIGDLGHEGGDLLHKTVNTALAACLEECGDGQCSDAAI